MRILLLCNQRLGLFVGHGLQPEPFGFQPYVHQKRFLRNCRALRRPMVPVTGYSRCSPPSPVKGSRFGVPRDDCTTQTPPREGLAAIRPLVIISMASCYRNRMCWWRYFAHVFFYFLSVPNGRQISKTGLQIHANVTQNACPRSLPRHRKCCTISMFGNIFIARSLLSMKSPKSEGSAMKRILSVCLALVLLLTAIPIRLFNGFVSVWLCNGGVAFGYVPPLPLTPVPSVPIIQARR